MKRLMFVMTLVVSLCATNFAQAERTSDGGISGGGGGTTNPEPVTLEQLIYVMKEFMAPIALSWVKGREAGFEDLSPEEQAASPLKIFFRGSKDIYSTLLATKVDLRTERPCYDLDGQEREASIVADAQGAVCMSPFLMAPKLSNAAAIKEATALYMHEISHLLSSVSIRTVDSFIDNGGLTRYVLEINVLTSEGVKLKVLQDNGPSFAIRRSFPKHDRLGRPVGCHRSEIWATGGGFPVVNAKTGVTVAILLFDPELWTR